MNIGFKEIKTNENFTHRSHLTETRVQINRIYWVVGDGGGMKGGGGKQNQFLKYVPSSIEQKTLNKINK